MVFILSGYIRHSPCSFSTLYLLLLPPFKKYALKMANSSPCSVYVYRGCYNRWKGDYEMDIRDLIRLGAYLKEHYGLDGGFEVMVVASDSERRVRVLIPPPEFIRREDAAGKKKLFSRLWPAEYEEIVLDWVHPGNESFSYPVLVGYGHRSNTLVVALKGDTDGH
jgi:hypothetical protein